MNNFDGNFYRCAVPSCCKKFISLISLLHHHAKKHPEVKIPKSMGCHCRFCKSKFHCLDDLEEHVRTVHEKKRECSNDGIGSTPPDVRNLNQIIDSDITNENNFPLNDGRSRNSSTSNVNPIATQGSNSSITNDCSFYNFPPPATHLNVFNPPLNSILNANRVNYGVYPSPNVNIINGVGGIYRPIVPIGLHAYPPTFRFGNPYIGVPAPHPNWSLPQYMNVDNFTDTTLSGTNLHNEQFPRQVDIDSNDEFRANSNDCSISKPKLQEPCHASRELRVEGISERFAGNNPTSRNNSPNSTPTCRGEYTGMNTRNGTNLHNEPCQIDLTSNHIASDDTFRANSNDCSISNPKLQEPPCHASRGFRVEDISERFAGNNPTSSNNSSNSAPTGTKSKKDTKSKKGTKNKKKWKPFPN